MSNRETVHEALKDLRPIEGSLVSCFEIESPENSKEYHVFEIGHNKNYIVIGSISNSGMLPDFWIEKDYTFSLDEQLQAIYDLITEAIYNGEINELNGLIEL